MYYKKTILFCLILTYVIAMYGQQPSKPSSVEIYKSIEKLNFLGNALFVAAHPDDENTRLISYLVNELNAHTTYLSITRGDGGQNLIGPEIRELLGVIRTQELLAARRVDGGNQMFTRANDFGYSKNAEETISIWDNDLVKQDVVWAIRQTRPDVIINRFDHRTSGTTHGHHTASAMLSHELFEKAASDLAYTEHFKYVQPWKAQRLFFNLSWWFFGSQEAFKKADKSNFVAFDTGVFFPLLGKSNTEIAALSRSNHRCQGFGSTGTRGSQLEYLELLKGDMPNGKANVFEGINTTWTRIKSGDKIKAIMDDVQSQYDFKAPHKSVPALIKAMALIEKIDDVFWKERKTKEIKNVIAACLGLYFDAVTNVHTATNGEQIKIDIEAINRSAGRVTLKGLTIIPTGKDTTFTTILNDNENYVQSYLYTIPQEVPLTNAYWLNENGSKGMYKVNNLEWIGKPETPRMIKVRFKFEIEGKTIDYDKEVSYKFNDDEKGEIYRPLEITPDVFVSFVDKVYVFGNQETQRIKVTVKAGAANLKGSLHLPTDKGWQVSPSHHDFDIKDKYGSKEFVFEVTPPTQASEAVISPIAIVNGKKYSSQQININYDHIPYQMVFQPAEAKLVKLDIQKSGSNVGYVHGAGDEIPQCLRQIGYRVEDIDVSEISAERIQKFDAIILGVRAYNTKDDLKFKQEDLHKYVYEGGTLIVQYNTSGETVVKNVGPFPMKIGRDRVTVEEAEVRILEPNHELMNYPNKIVPSDFDGWIQERGLYFASEWDKNYTAILSSNDPKEEAKNGGLLVAKYGDGYFIYTGYSWFRQLPSGVPGAFRLFANMVSLGNDKKP